VFGGELIRGAVPEETRPDEHHRGGSFSMCRRGFSGNATKGTGTTHGADQPPKKTPIAAPKMTPIRIIAPVTCVPFRSPNRQLERLQKVFAAVYCQALFC
jgi:hypothetical protein